MAEDKKIQPGAFDYSEADNKELQLAAQIFNDGSRIVPHITIASGRRYVPWRDNGETTSTVDYPLHLLELYNNSSLHHSIINLKTRRIAGGGLELVDPNSPHAQKTLDFLQKEHEDGLDCNEINRRIIFDYELFNGFSIQCVYTKDFKKIDTLRHLEFNKIRIQTPEWETLNVWGFFWSLDWSTYRPSRMQFIERWNPNTAELNNKQYKEIYDRIMEFNKPEDVLAMKNFLTTTPNTQLYYHKEYQPNSYYYPLPPYLGICGIIETDIQTDIYAMSSLVNGMDSGIIITILGDSSDPESQKTAKRILKSYAGARRAGRPVILFTPSFEEAPKIEPINNTNSLAQKYNLINQSVQQKILSGHNIPNSAMVGIATQGKLGTTHETTSAEEIFFSTYVLPRQIAIEAFWNKIMKYNGLDEVRIINRNVFNASTIDTRESGLPIPGDPAGDRIVPYTGMPATGASSKPSYSSSSGNLQTNPGQTA